MTTSSSRFCWRGPAHRQWRRHRAHVDPRRLLEEKHGEYLYLAAVRFGNEARPLGEHSPMLNDISALGSWRTVGQGLARMYEGEVLGKLPVVQHFLFGTILPWPSQE